MKTFFFLSQFTIILVSDLSNAFGQSRLLLCDLMKRGSGSVKGLSESFELIFEGFVLLRKGVLLFFEVIILVFEDLYFLLHDIFVEVHFLSHFLNHSLRVFAWFGLRSWLHSAEKLIFLFEVVFFKSNFTEFFFDFLKFSLLVIEPVGPLILKGLEFLFLLVSDFLDL